MSPASYIWVGRGDEHSDTNIDEISLKCRKNHVDPLSSVYGITQLGPAAIPK